MAFLNGMRLRWPTSKSCGRAESERDRLLRTIEDFERTVAEFRSNNVVLSTTVLSRRLEEIVVSATALGDPILNAMIEKMRRELTTGKGLDG